MTNDNFIPVPISLLVIIGMVFTVIIVCMLVKRHYTTVRNSKIRSSLRFDQQFIRPFEDISEILNDRDEKYRISMVDGYFKCSPVLRANKPSVIYRDGLIFVRRSSNKVTKFNINNCYFVFNQEACSYMREYQQYTVSNQCVSVADDKDFVLYSRSVYCYKKDVGEVLALLYKKYDYGTPIEC